MPYTVYRLELDGSETVIGYAKDRVVAMMIMDADKENVDFEAGYRWHNEGADHDTERIDP